MTWDDRKTGDYPFQTDFSYRANQISTRRWLGANLALGILLGALMALVLFVVPNTVLSDIARLMIALLVGGGTTRYLEQRAERTTRAAQAAMALTFAAGTLIFALTLLA